jgi:hypothetical protein
MQAPSHQQFPFRKIKIPLFLAVFFILHLFILNNFVLLYRDMVAGDYSATKLSPAPRLKIRRIQIRKYNALNRLGIDFAQVYFPSKALSNLERNYSEGDDDPLKRPSRYAPLIHYLCAISICNLDYGRAAFLHMLIQLALFYLSLFYAIKILDLKNYLLPSVLLVNYFLFLTPVGISWFERGQFSLYVATAYLWLILGLRNRNLFLILLAACFSFVKWTSLPFIFVLLVVNILGNIRNTKELKHAFLSAGIFAAVFVMFSLPFIGPTKFYLIGLYQQELTYEANGISLMVFLPRTLVKALPFLLIGLGWLAIRRLKEPMLLIPYFTGVAILLITYPTIAIDYSTPVLMGFIPLLFAWVRLPQAANSPVNGLTLILFFFFLLGASFSREIRLAIPITGADVLLYVIAGLVLACLPLFYPSWKMLENHSSEPKTLEFPKI